MEWLGRSLALPASGSVNGLVHQPNQPFCHIDAKSIDSATLT